MQESFTSSSSRQNACEMNVDISNPEDISIPRRKGKTHILLLSCLTTCMFFQSAIYTN